MALTTASMTGAIITAAQARFPGSQVTPKLAAAVSRSVLSWISVSTNVTVQGVTTGTAGAGSVNGKLGFSGPANLVSAALTQAGVTGPTAPGIGGAVGRGVLATLNASAQYTGASVGVGTGSDVSKVSNSNSATLIPILLANLGSQSVGGASASQLATGLGRGIADLVKTGAGAGGVVGIASPVAAAGTSVSVVF
jgi:hypothetical protein